MFQSTLPQGERPSSCAHRYSRGKFQSTLPQGERPPIGAFSVYPQPVSIHAPAGGATFHNCLFRIAISFNPRSRRGSDGFRLPKGRCLPVSIHAPAGGATQQTRLIIPCLRVFQSTLPQGERQGNCDFFSCSGGFNPRSRRGSDRFPPA